jgi:hypothetical protein
MREFKPDALRDKMLRLILSDPRTRMIEIEGLSHAELKAMISAVNEKEVIRKLVQSRIISAIRHKALQLN